ncbi:MAG: glucosaminidase domain-containing protein, partial [Bacteroidota bacterium]
MKKPLLLLAFLFTSLNILAQSKQTVEGYIAKYLELAMQEMRIYKIPASITLAQGLLESGNGNSELALNANNHFGIKCKNEWTGDKYYYDDDEKHECFRKYKSDTDSYRDHSLFLTKREYYKALFLLDICDYKGWANGLKKAGYATEPMYAEMLIKIIEDNQLYNYDCPGQV